MATILIQIVLSTQCNRRFMMHYLLWIIFARAYTPRYHGYAGILELLMVLKDSVEMKIMAVILRNNLIIVFTKNKKNQISNTLIVILYKS